MLDICHSHITAGHKLLDCPGQSSASKIGCHISALYITKKGVKSGGTLSRTYYRNTIEGVLTQKFQQDILPQYNRGIYNTEISTGQSTADLVLLG